MVAEMVVGAGVEGKNNSEFDKWYFTSNTEQDGSLCRHLVHAWHYESLFAPCKCDCERGIIPHALHQCLFYTIFTLCVLLFCYQKKNWQTLPTKSHTNKNALLVCKCWKFNGSQRFSGTPKILGNYVLHVPWNFRYNVEVNTLQEWYLINTSPTDSHPIHMHVYSFQVCKQNVCWRTTNNHKLCKSYTRKCRD